MRPAHSLASSVTDVRYPDPTFGYRPKAASGLTNYKLFIPAEAAYALASFKPAAACQLARAVIGMSADRKTQPFHDTIVADCVRGQS